MEHTNIVGIPVTIIMNNNNTEITARWSDLTPIQVRLIKGWLEYKGNVVVSTGDTIKVEGQLTLGTLAD